MSTIQTKTMTEMLKSRSESYLPEVGYPAGSREDTLRALLPYDYDYAEDSGLIDMFYYDEKTGEDGLIHTLAGSVRGGEGGFTSEGYHHEESGEKVWAQRTPDVNGGQIPVTHVDRSHLAEANSTERAKYREFPYEPYQGQVVINGLKKVSLHLNKETGERTIVPAKNTMFPREYDALAVMQAARAAFNNQDTESQIFSKDANGAPVIVSTGYAPLVDGKSKMPIKLILDADTLKIKSAIPVTKRKPGIMKLTPEEADKHTYGDL